MKIHKITTYLLAASLFMGAVGCKNPLKDFDLQISTEVIKNTATVKIVDVDGQPITGATVSLNSGDIQNIYNLDGRKDFKVVEGQVVFGLDPNVRVAAGNAVRFRIEVKASGYYTQIVPIAITDANTGITVVTLMKPTEVPGTGGVEEVQASVELAANGATTVATTIEIPPSTPGEPTMSLSIPAGTQFKDANGNIILGGAVTISVAAFDTDNDDVKSLLPGGGLTADGVVLADGRTAPGTFSAAGVTRINMVINGITVRQFSQPIAVGVPVPADYISPISGLPIQTGQSFDIYSNSSTDNTWRHERAVVIAGSPAAGYRANFELSHLSYFMVAEFGESCATGAIVNFSGDWMNNGATYPVMVEAVWGGDVIFSRTYSINQGNASLLIDGLPDGTKLSFKNAAGNLLEETVLASCGQVTAVQLPNPGDATGQLATLQLYVRCPNKTTTITLLPTFHMYYRVAGTGDYKFLGTVDNGLLRTSLLKTDGTKYDFKAFYNTRVKNVLNKAISADNNATVGIGPGDIIGEKAGATNLAILTEECAKL